MCKWTTMSRSCWMVWTRAWAVGRAISECDATVCNPVIYAPGPFGTFPGVGWLKNLNICFSAEEMELTGKPAIRCGFRTASFRGSRNTVSGRARNGAATEALN